MTDESKDRHVNGDESQDRAHNQYQLFDYGRDKQGMQTSRSFKGCETFLNKLRRSNPTLYQRLVNLTNNYASNHKQSVMSYHQELKRLLAEHTEIAGDLNKLLYTDARIVVERKSEPITHEPQQRNNQYYFIQNISNNPILQSRDIYRNFNDSSQRRLHPLISLSASKNELTLFEQLRVQIQQHFAGHEEEFNVFFSEFMKVLSLYNECVISHYDFMELVNQVPWFDRDMVDQLCIITMSRAQARRATTTLFKPLKDTDFKQAERVTRSYVRMHPGYANTTTAPSTLTNQMWVSVPFGSEDYSFQIMRKNTYEEQLFKIEDETYEFDWNALCYKRCIQYLDELAQTDCPQQQETLVYKILNLKVLQAIYKNSASDQQQMITLLEQNPKGCANIIKQRVQLKRDEMVETRNNGAKISWHVVQMNNFHRSLDHRSFYFKKNEKQFTCASRFLKEPEERFKNLQNHFYPEQLDESLQQGLKKKEERPIPFRLEEMSQYLNSFALLTTYQPLSSLQQPQMLLLPSKENFVQVPIFNLYLPKREILIESFLFLIHYSQTASHFSNGERTWMFRFLIQMAHGFFKLQLNPIDFGKLITSEQILKTEVLQIEQTIFDANFSYLQSYQFQSDEPKLCPKESTSPNPEQAKEQAAMESEGDSHLSKLLSVSPSQTEQDVYTMSKIRDSGARWLNLYPHADQTFRVLYGSQGLYLFFRFFYTIYQRLEIAQEISFKFDTNSKTESLIISFQTLEIKYQERYQIGLKRYKLFKSALFQSLGSKDFKYEDYLRSIYAKQAFLFSTMEKLFQDSCKQLASLQSDRVVENQLNFIFQQNPDTDSQLQSMMNEFTKPSKMEQSYPTSLFHLDTNISEVSLHNIMTQDMQFALLTHSMIENIADKSEKSIFRFAYSESDSSQLTINYIPYWGSFTDKHQLQKSHFNLTHYITTNQSAQKTFLKRSIQKKPVKSKVFYQNELEFQFSDNAELRPFKPHKEDILIVRRMSHKKKPQIIKNHVRNSLSKVSN